MASKKAMYEYGVGGDGGGGGGRSGRSYSVGSKGMFGYGCGYGGALYSDNSGGCKKSSAPSRFGDSGYKSSSSSGSHSNGSGNGTTTKVGTQVFVRYSTSASAKVPAIPYRGHLS